MRNSQTLPGYVTVTIGDGANLDAFQRLRVSDPVTLFDYQSEYDEGSLLWGATTSGTASQTHDAANSSVNLTTGTTAADSIIRQTLQYHRYQPGKSQLVLSPFDLQGMETNNRARIGYFDDDNGVFLEEYNGTTSFVIRNGASDTAVAQASWNLDTYPALDLAKAQILVIDLEWLGVGRVRIGFVHEGQITYCHEFMHDNTGSGVYMRTANLPLRYELTNVDGGTADIIKAICASVISEGGFESDRGIPFCSSNGTTTIGVTTRRPILSIRPKATFNSITNRGEIIITGINALAETNNAYLEIVYNGSLTGANFASVNADSITESDVAATAISGGIVVNALYVPAASQGNQQSPGSNQLGLLSRLPLTLDKAGANPINLSVVATSFSATSNVTSSLYWQELR